jgi:hypothetical protein
LSIAPQAEDERRGARARERSVAPAASGAWPLPPAWVDYLSLDSIRTTVLYWSGVALVVAGLFATKLLPCVDYPQHLALSDVARRLAVPGAPEHAEYELNYFTYNGLFHVLVARVSTLLPIELAGRLVVASSLLLLAGAVIALVRLLRRPPTHAALFTPILFSFSLGWGFVNYVLATAIAAWAVFFVARAALRPSVKAMAAVAGLGLLCAFAHVLAMLILCLVAAALAPEAAWRGVPRSTSRWKRAFFVFMRATLAATPLLIGCVYCIDVYRRQYPWDPNMYRDPTMEGSSPWLWEKVVYFSAFATDLFRDATDQILLWAAILVMGWSARLAWKRRRALEKAPNPLGPPGPDHEPPPIVAPFVVLTIAYFATPMVLVGTHLIFPRLAQWVILTALLATPRFPEAVAARANEWMLRIGLAVGANTLLHCAFFDWETRDASALIDDLPAGGAVTAVIWDPETLAFRNGPLTHLAGYYGARKHGRWAFAFARYLSVPVRFKEYSQPAWPARGWEFEADDYDPRCKYARAFPLVIVKAPGEVPVDAGGEPVVRKLVFKQDAQAVRLISHRGRYWAFDTKGLPDDGTF